MSHTAVDLPQIVIEMSQTWCSKLGNDLSTSLIAPLTGEVARQERRVSFARGGPDERLAADMFEIVAFGLIAIAVVIVMAGVLGRLVAHDDISSYIEG